MQPSDEPGFVELNAMWGAPEVRKVPLGSGLVVFSPVERLGVLWGAVDEAALARLAAGWDAETSLLCYPDNVDAVRSALPGWAWGEARQHVLRDERVLSGIESHGVRPCGPAQLQAADLPEAQRRRMLGWAQRGTVVAAWDAGRPVAFASAPWRTARWYDISVETLPEYRRRGYATRAFAALWRQLRGDGLAPVWGAETTNAASLGMAYRLGFRPVAEIHVFTGPGK